jgi:hypothetical protein
MTRDRNDRTSIADVNEISGNYVTVKTAAEILGLNVATMSSKIYDHKFQSVRIGGIILCDKASVLNYKAEREQMEMARAVRRQEKDRDASARAEDRKLLETLKGLTREQRDAILAQS